MAYNPKTWKNDKSGKTPIDADDLNRMEKGIENALERVFSKTTWGNSLQSTEINVNAGSGGKTYLICYSTHSSTGDATISFLGILRCGHSDNNYSITQIIKSGTGTLIVNFSIDTSGNLQFQNSSQNGASKVSIYALT